MADCDIKIRMDEETLAAVEKLRGLRRDAFASAALTGMIASRNLGDPRDPGDAPHASRAVERAYAWADLMLAESDRRNQKDG